MFELACTCGETRFSATAGLDDEGEYTGPIAIACAACEASFAVFDPAKDGYDAELSGLPATEHVELEDLVSLEVEAPHEIVVRFEYPSDHLGDPEWRGRESELFSWFTLLARDAVTKQLGFLFEAECA